MPGGDGMEVQFIGFPDVLWRVTGGGLAAVCQLEVSLHHEGTHDQVLSRSVHTQGQEPGANAWHCWYGRRCRSTAPSGTT